MYAVVQCSYMIQYRSCFYSSRSNLGIYLAVLIYQPGNLPNRAIFLHGWSGLTVRKIGCLTKNKHLIVENS